jgi:hypothetical protein
VTSGHHQGNALSAWLLLAGLILCGRRASKRALGRQS